jgi:hypothetical protein
MPMMSDAPAAEGAAALRVHAVQTVEALAARRNGAHDDSLAGRIRFLESGTELLDDANGLVAQDEPRRDRILASHDVDVGSANRRGGDANHCLARSRSGPRNLLHGDLIFSFEHDRFHGLHGNHSC